MARRGETGSGIEQRTKVLKDAWVDSAGNVVDQAGNVIISAAAQALVSGAWVPRLPLVRVVSWVGDGASTRTVTGIGFAADLVILKSEAVAPAYFWHRMCWRGNSPKLGEATPHTNVVQNTTNDAIVVNAVANATGVSYHALAIADNSSGQIAVGSYAGNGVDNRAIAVGLEPIFVAVKRDNSHYCWVRARGMTTSYALQGVASADHIKSLTATGFTIGTSEEINAATAGQGSGGEAYDWFALADSAVWRVVQFVGSGSARTLNLLQSPAFALVKAHDSVTPRDAQIAFSGMAGSSADINGATAAGVMGLSGGALSLGDSAVTNGSTVTNTALVIAESAAPQLVEVRPGLPAVLIGTNGGMIAPTRNTDFALNGVPLSLEVAFVYRDTAPATVLTLLSVNEDNTNPGHHFGLYLSSSSHRSLSVQFKDTAGTQTSEIGYSPKSGELVHLGVSFDGVSEWLIVVNGRVIKHYSLAEPITATATPANAKVTVGNRRSGSDLVSPSFDCETMSFVLWRIYGSALTLAQWKARYRRSILRDYSQTDVVPLEEWDAANVVGSTLYSSLKGANNMTLISCTTETV